MSFKVQVGPPQIAIHHASAVLVTEANGEMRWPSDKGLYLNDTRLISAWSVQANGEDWDIINGGAVRHSTARVYLTNRQFLTEDGPITPRSLALVLSRHIEGGMHEDLEITNHGRAAVASISRSWSGPISPTFSMSKSSATSGGAVSIPPGRRTRP